MVVGLREGSGTFNPSDQMDKGCSAICCSIHAPNARFNLVIFCVYSVVDEEESPFVLLVDVVAIDVAVAADGILKPLEVPADDAEAAADAKGRPALKDDPVDVLATGIDEKLLMVATLDAPNELSCLMPLEKGRGGAVVLLTGLVAAAVVVAPNPVRPVKPPKGFEDAAAGVVACCRGVVIGKPPPKGPAANPANGLFDDDAVSDINEDVSPPVERLGRTIFLLESSSCDALDTGHLGR